MKGFNTVVRMAMAGVLMAIAGAVAAQQAYPAKPIRLIVPYPPGGGTNILARLVGQKLTESLGQPVIVDNRGGGNTIIGTEALVKSAPDGYTISVATTTLVVLPHMYRTLPYDAFKETAPVTTIAKTQYVLVVNPSVPANTLQQFIDLAKAKPGQLNYASSGIGGADRWAAILFENLTGVKMQLVSYKGTGPGLTDLLAGHVQLWFIGPINAIPHIKTGRLKPIAITGDSRLATLPQVPTFSEAGLRGFDIETWYGVLAPAGTAKDIVEKLSTEIATILAIPDVREKLENQGMRPFISTTAQFSALLKSDFAKYGNIIKTANIELEN